MRMSHARLIRQRDAKSTGEQRRTRVTPNANPSQLCYNSSMPQPVATHIELRPNRDGQDRAFIEGTRVRVQDVAMLAEVDGNTPDEIVAALPHLTLAQVHAALSYYFDHRPAILQEMREDEELVNRLRGPSLLDRKLTTTTGAASDPLPSG
jgi:uncharacterized protein (DUF433 family)